MEVAALLHIYLIVKYQVYGTTVMNISLENFFLIHEKLKADLHPANFSGANDTSRMANAFFSFYT